MDISLFLSLKINLKHFLTIIDTEGQIKGTILNYSRDYHSPKELPFLPGTLPAHQMLLYLIAATVRSHASASILTSAQILHASLAFFTVSS